jgi:hypothetical protein
MPAQALTRATASRQKQECPLGPKEGDEVLALVPVAALRLDERTVKEGWLGSVKRNMAPRVAPRRRHRANRFLLSKGQ